MIRSRLPEAETCYWEWQKFVKQEIERLQRKHWWDFLAKADKNLTFKALAYTLPASTGSIAPLYRADKSITTEKEEQSELLLFGTSIALTECSAPPALTGTPPQLESIPIIPSHRSRKSYNTYLQRRPKARTMCQMSYWNWLSLRSVLYYQISLTTVWSQASIPHSGRTPSPQSSANMGNIINPNQEPIDLLHYIVA